MGYHIDMNGVFPPLATPRLILRCPESTDAEAISRLMTPGVADRLATWPAPMTPDLASTRIARALAWASERKAMPLAVIRIADGCFIGWIEITLTPDGKAGLGYWLGEEFHGHGYMREAAPEVFKVAVSYLGADGAIAGCQPENAASIAVLEGCGMRFIGERMYFASARNREELTRFYEITADQLAAR